MIFQITVVVGNNCFCCERPVTRYFMGRGAHKCELYMFTVTLIELRFTNRREKEKLNIQYLHGNPLINKGKKPPDKSIELSLSGKNHRTRVENFPL